MSSSYLREVSSQPRHNRLHREEHDSYLLLLEIVMLLLETVDFLADDVNLGDMSSNCGWHEC